MNAAFGLLAKKNDRFAQAEKIHRVVLIANPTELLRNQICAGDDKPYLCAAPSTRQLLNRSPLRGGIAQDLAALEQRAWQANEEGAARINKHWLISSDSEVPFRTRATDRRINAYRQAPRQGVEHIMNDRFALSAREEMAQEAASA